MPDNEAEIIEAIAEAIIATHVSFDGAGYAKAIRSNAASGDKVHAGRVWETALAQARAALAASPIERLQARVAELEAAEKAVTGA